MPRSSRKSRGISITGQDFPLIISQGGYYRLVEDVSGSVHPKITFTSTESVILDFNGHTLGDVEISIRQTHQLYLKNGYLQRGILSLEDCSNVRIHRINFESVGIVGTGLRNVYLSHLQLNNVLQDGIVLSCQNGQIKNCIISRSPSGSTLSSGMKLHHSSHLVIQNNMVTGFTLGSSRNDSEGAGIVISSCTSCIIRENIVSGNNFGIKDCPVGSGQDNTYLRNVAVGNVIDNYIGLNPFLIAIPSATAGAWVNISN